MFLIIRYLIVITLLTRSALAYESINVMANGTSFYLSISKNKIDYRSKERSFNKLLKKCINKDIIQYKIRINEVVKKILISNNRKLSSNIVELDGEKYYFSSSRENYERLSQIQDLVKHFSILETYKCND